MVPTPRVLGQCLAAAIGLVAWVSSAASGTVTVTTTTLAPSAAAEAHALLALKDMPAGWTSAPSTSGGASIPGVKRLATCIGVQASALNSNPPQIDSPDFSSPDSSLGVLDSINVYKTAAATKADFDSLLNAKTPGCTQSYLNSVSGHAALDKASGGGIGKLTVTRAMGLPSGVGGLDIRFAVSEQSTTTHVELIFAVFIKGDLEENLGFTAINTTFPNALERQLTALAIARL